MRVHHWPQVIGCAALALVVLVATGCGNDAKKDKLSPQDSFLVDMIPHHEGAVEWAKLVLERGERPELREMAAATIKGSTADIEEMQRLLGPEKMLKHKGHSHGGEHFGPAGIAQIRKGVITDKVLLDWMIDHHAVGTDAGHGTVPQIDNAEIMVLVESMNGRLDKGLDKMRAWRIEWYGV
jgi:uncharacterized protein (DUF305 family)